MSMRSSRRSRKCAQPLSGWAPREPMSSNHPFWVPPAIANFSSTPASDQAPAGDGLIEQLFRSSDHGSAGISMMDASGQARHFNLVQFLSYDQARQASGGHRFEAQQEGSRAHHAAID